MDCYSNVVLLLTLTTKTSEDRRKVTDLMISNRDENDYSIILSFVDKIVRNRLVRTFVEDFHNENKLDLYKTMNEDRTEEEEEDTSGRRNTVRCKLMEISSEDLMNNLLFVHLLGENLPEKLICLDLMMVFSSIDFFEMESDFLFQYLNMFEQEVPMDFDLNHPIKVRGKKTSILISLDEFENLPNDSLLMVVNIRNWENFFVSKT